MNAVCENLKGSYRCKCPAGFAGDGFSCADLDECVASHACLPGNTTCVNTPGSYFCISKTTSKATASEGSGKIQGGTKNVTAKKKIENEILKEREKETNGTQRSFCTET